MRRLARPVDGVHVVVADWRLAVVAAALLIGRPSWAQSLPNSVFAPAAESQASIESQDSTAATAEASSPPASLPEVAPPSLPGDPDPDAEKKNSDRRATPQQPWWRQVNWSTIATGALCTGVGLAPCVMVSAVAAMAFYVLSSMTMPCSLLFLPCSFLFNVTAPVALFAPCNALLAPIAIGAGAKIDSMWTHRPWWPAAIGAAAGWLVLAPAIGAGVAVFATNPLHAENMGSRPNGLPRIPPVVFQAAFGVAAGALVTSLTAPVSLAGALVTGWLLQPDSGSNDGPAAMPGEE